MDESQTLAMVCGWMDRETFMYPLLADTLAGYNPLVHSLMTADQFRQAAYTRAIEQVAAGKTFVDIGTGPYVIWARTAIKAGAERVYAIEANPEMAEMARELVNSDPDLRGKIEVITGLSTEIDLGDRVDGCLSEVIGCLTSSEGVIPILNDARERFLVPDGIMIPRQGITFMAPATKPTNLFHPPELEAITQAALGAARAGLDYQLEITRWMIYGFPSSCLLADATVFEDIRFMEAVNPEVESAVEFTITKGSTFHGFVFWIELGVGPGQTVNTMMQRTYAWAPVLIEASQPVDVAVGDVLRVTCRRTLNQDRMHPDYSFQGSVEDPGGGLKAPIEIVSPYPLK